MTRKATFTLRDAGNGEKKITNESENLSYSMKIKKNSHLVRDSEFLLNIQRRTFAFKSKRLDVFLEQMQTKA